MHDELAARNDLECVTGARALNGPGLPFPGLAHDIGNLLQAAISAINTIEREAGTGAAQVRRAINGARISIGHASELVRRAFDGRAAQGGVTGESSLEQCLAEVASVLSASSLGPMDIGFTIEADLPPISCDRVGLHNALFNLVLNARDAVSEHGRIAVHARRLEADGLVEISVADDGIGMSRATIERAFEPFFTTKCDGLGGIGLPMVERFVTGAGGSIAVDSKPGAGTIVRMRLPAAAGALLEGKSQP